MGLASNTNMDIVDTLWKKNMRLIENDIEHTYKYQTCLWFKCSHPDITKICVGFVRRLPVGVYPSNLFLNSNTVATEYILHEINKIPPAQKSRLYSSTSSVILNKLFDNIKNGTWVYNNNEFIALCTNPHNLAIEMIEYIIKNIKYDKHELRYLLNNYNPRTYDLITKYIDISELRSSQRLLNNPNSKIVELYTTQLYRSDNYGINWEVHAHNPGLFTINKAKTNKLIKLIINK